jgi:membrane associated rhomboid family serine protease
MARPSNLLNFINSTVRRYQQATPFYGDYFREVRSKKLLIWSCIGVNTVVWLWWQAATAPRSATSSRQKAMKAAIELKQNFLLSVENLREGRWWTLVTSAFSHISLGHLFVNMLAFHQLGQVLVYTPGLKAGRHFGILILGSILAGSAAFLSHESTIHPGAQRVGLGFSSAVAGVVTAAACLMPYQQVLLFGVIPLPLWALGLGYIAYDTYSMDGDTTVAHDAHIGGAVFGGAYYLLVLRRFGGILGRRGWR